MTENKGRGEDKKEPAPTPEGAVENGIYIDVVVQPKDELICGIRIPARKLNDYADMPVTLEIGGPEIGTVVHGYHKEDGTKMLRLRITDPDAIELIKEGRELPEVSAAVPQRPVQIGRIVHYVLNSQMNVGGDDKMPHIVYEERPAIVVRPYSDECVNLQVFTDGYNDREFSTVETGENTKKMVDKMHMQNVEWRTSVAHDADKKELGTWHWPDE